MVQAPPGAPSDYLNVYAVSVQKPVQDMHLFGPLLERKKAPWAQKEGRLADCARAVPAGLSFRPGAGGQVSCKAKSRGRRDHRQCADRRRARMPRRATSRRWSSRMAQRVDGDFFIDATGFRKRLIVGELKAPWISYQHELPVNRALPFWLPVEEGEEIANYTRAWAQEAGWMWQIPTQYPLWLRLCLFRRVPHARRSARGSGACARPQDRGARRHPVQDRAAGERRGSATSLPWG